MLNSMLESVIGSKSGPSSENLSNVTGIWRTDARVTDSGVYFVTQLGHRVFWLGVSAKHHWAHVFVGTFHGTVIAGEWGDIPLGRDMYSGTLELGVSGERMVLRTETGGFGCQEWTRVSANEDNLDVAFFDAVAGYWGDEQFTGVWDNDKVDRGAGPGVYFLSQWNDRVFWFGYSKAARQYANVGIGKVAQSGLVMEWCDIPMGGDAFHGTLTLAVNECDERMVRLSDLPHEVFGGMEFKKRDFKQYSKHAKWQQRPFTLCSAVGVHLQAALEHDGSGSISTDALISEYGLGAMFDDRVCQRGREEALIWLYTLETKFYMHLNRNLGKDSLTLPKWVSYVLETGRALQAQGESFVGTVYRGIQMDDAAAAAYATGTQFTWPQFVSTSKDIDVARGFGNWVFVIVISASGLAHSIEHMTACPGEEEVLVAPCACFEVKELTQNAVGGQISIQLAAGQTERVFTGMYS
jgi:hypothetical protein